MEGTIEEKMEIIIRQPVPQVIREKYELRKSDDEILMEDLDNYAAEATEGLRKVYNGSAISRAMERLGIASPHQLAVRFLKEDM